MLDKLHTTFFVGILALLMAGNAHAENRVALVIGNSIYQNTPALANPEHDAEDMASALKRVGFDVIFEHDLDKRGMEHAIARFARAARDSDAVVFYYAGHGMQYRGLNYLMPVDAKLEDEFSLDFEMTRLEDVLRALNQSRGVKILLLDACRRNPLFEKLAVMATSRDFVSTRGLARIYASRGMVLVYSTQADQVAGDGSGRNSPFTTALLKQMAEPGLEIGTLLRRVAADVNKTTGGTQLPEVSISLLGEFYFVRPDTDAQAWAKLRGSQDAAQLKDFLIRYSKSPLAADVRERLDAIERAERARLERERQAQLERERLAQEQADRLRREQMEQDRVRREQLAREQAAIQAQRERLAREQAALTAQREQLAKVEEERARLAQQQPAERDKPPAANAQIAMVTPPPPAQPPSAAPLVGSALVLEIKRQLKRVGCYAGPIDDKWTTAATKASIVKFRKFASVQSAADEATVEFLEMIRSKAERVCPLECTARQIDKDGHCVAKVCARGFVLGKAGQCVRRERTASRPRATTTPSAKNDTNDATKRVKPGPQVTCGRRGCQTVPAGCYAIRGAGGHKLGGRIVCP